MAPKRKYRGDGEVETHAQWTERQAKAIRYVFGDPKRPIAIHMRNLASNRHLPLDDQIQLQLKPLVEDGILGSSFYDPIASLPRLRSYELIRESVDRFVGEGDVLCNDLKQHLGRWDPDLKSAAVAAKGIVGIAQSICMDYMVGLGNKLEAKCLAGNDPFEIIGLCHRVRDFYQLNKALGASPATKSLSSADCLSSAPPPTAGPSAGPN